MNLTPSESAHVVHVVAEADTASQIGSGDLRVLGTPRLIAWCEEATCATLDLDSGMTSVGTRVRVDHLAPSTVGDEVTTTARVAEVDGRLVKFEVLAKDASEQVLAKGTVERVVVDRERFMGRLTG